MLSLYTRNLRNQSLRTLSSLLLDRRNDAAARSCFSANSINGIGNVSDTPSAEKMWSCFNGARRFSAKSMRSKVEKRMQRESGKTLREIRRAKKLRKKLMTDEERLIYNLRRAKKKVALLLQKLKKYELPELPAPRHDPELLTAEQLQAFKKIGFRNKNYVPVGVRGVFGGVVQNMHMHWKFHETVQVCCDNFPKEKIKEMASMLTRLSGGIVINVHNVKTIIMFRGRNYRQPKNLIPINTLTKRKALFKARFEQALESQKLNIKKIEQDLRRKGVNPDDPVAMASIQRVASTFFNAIDKREGSPYVFKEDKATAQMPPEDSQQPQDGGEDSDQEELDRFIAEIEDAADKEWEEEESAEKEELNRIRYWNREDFGGRHQRFEGNRFQDSDDGSRDRMRYGNQRNSRRASDSEGEGDDGFVSDEAPDKSNARRQHSKTDRVNSRDFRRNDIRSNGRQQNKNAVREHALSDLEDVPKASKYFYTSGSDDDDDDEFIQLEKKGSNASRGSNKSTAREHASNDLEDVPKASKYFYSSSSDDDENLVHLEKQQKGSNASRGANKNTIRGHALSDLEDVPKASKYFYSSSSGDDEDFVQLEKHKGNNASGGASATTKDTPFAEDDLFSESELAQWGSDATSGESDNDRSR